MCKDVIGDKMSVLEGLLSDLGVLLAPKGCDADINQPLLCTTPAETLALLCTHVLKGQPSWTGEFMIFSLPVGELHFPCIANIDETDLVAQEPTPRVLFEVDIAWRIVKSAAPGSWVFRWLTCEVPGSMDFIKILGASEVIDFEAQRKKVKEYAAGNTALRQLKKALLPWWAQGGGGARKGKVKGKGKAGKAGKGGGGGRAGRRGGGRHPSGWHLACGGPGVGRV